MVNALLLAVALALLPTPVAPEVSRIPDVVLVEGNYRELQAKAQLLRIWSQFDLSPWLFTEAVRINASSVPHSHPILTLNTRHLDNDLAQLSTFLHEQIHWYLESSNRQQALANALEKLRERYPDVPSHEDLGTRSDESSYLHLVVNWLEFDGMRQLIGERRAKQMLRTKDHYEWLYGRVLDDDGEIEAVLASEGLVIRSGR